MNEHFIYCFIKYVHSVRLDETLNVGLLMLFPKDKRVLFKYPKDLQRLKCTYHDFQEDQLKIYLKSFDKKANQLGILPPIFNDKFDDKVFLSFIRDEFLQQDEGAIQISNVRRGVKYIEDPEQIATELYYSYFQHYHQPDELMRRKIPKETLVRDEDYILSTLYSLIMQEMPRSRSIDFSGREIATNNVSIKFGFEWLNHGLHLVKPLGLDFRDKKAIEERAHSLHSKLHILDIESDLQNHHYDVLISKPRSSKLEGIYHKAISIIKESSDKTNIVEENQFAEYSKKAAEALSR